MKWKLIKFLCECGCGQEVRIGIYGKYNRFIAGHNLKKISRCKILTDEHKRKISLKHKGKRISEEQKNDISKKLKELWQDRKYRKMMINSSKKYWNKKSSKKRMSKATIKRFMKEEEREIISETLKKYFKDNPEKILKGVNHPFYGKKLSNEHKAAILKAISTPCTLNKKIKISCWHQGILKEQWKEFLTNNEYCDAWNDKEYKEDILYRDNYECQNPDCYGNYKILNRHHIDYDKKNCKPDNLITLCNGCNSRANYNRDYWKELYKNKIKEVER